MTDTNPAASLNRVLRIVATWYRDVNDGCSYDADDLAWNLGKAGFPLADVREDEGTDERDLPEATAQPTRYVVSCLPEDHVDRHLFEINIEYRKGRWAVTRHGSCLSTTGAWTFGVNTYGGNDAWVNAHRHDLDTALRLAKRAAARITVNGVSVRSVLARGAGR
ncbi:hypothetical protein ACFQ6V_23680 [Streptomyces roseifaciens]